MSQWDKLIADILREDAHLRFEDLCKALEKMGYTARQPRSGSSHYTFRKADHMPITIPNTAIATINMPVSIYCHGCGYCKDVQGKRGGNGP